MHDIGYTSAARHRKVWSQFTSAQSCWIRFTQPGGQCADGRLTLIPADN